MRLSKEQKFLYSRVAVLIALAISTLSVFAGSKGVPFWHVGLALCFFLAFALLNFPHKTSLWMLMHRRVPFLVFYAALLGSLFLFDKLALNLHLWFYPFYHDSWFLLVYGVLYPLAALSQLEFFYFLTHVLREPLAFRQHKETTMHTAVDWGEGILFLLMILLIALGAAGYSISLLTFFIVSVLWVLFGTAKLGLHIEHPAHLVLLLALIAVVATILNGFQGTVAFEWIYLGAPILNTIIWNVPLWVGLFWFWCSIFTLRLWIFLVLHPRVK